jgi:formylglycine-generating enzyme required for sulfatase activity
MGDPLVLLQNLDVPSPARVAVVAPYWLDAAEVTVGALRASGLATTSDPARGQGEPGACTYTERPGAHEALPVTCVSFDLAAKFCAKMGGQLPSEAEIELVGGGRASQRYPWGSEDPACGDAVFARADAVTAQRLIPQTAACASLGTTPTPAGSGARDAVILPGGTVVDLAGNVAEWARDVYQELGRDCWHEGLALDPVCAPPDASRSAPRTVRGGSWTAIAPFLRSTVRASGGSGRGDHATGFRCARPGR